jgi:hypothetical protein
MKMKRRKQKELARKTIRYGLKKYGVACYKAIWCDFWYEQCVYSLKVLGKLSVIFLLFALCSCSTKKEVYFIIPVQKKEVEYMYHSPNRFEKQFNQADSVFNKLHRASKQASNEALKDKVTKRNKPERPAYNRD